jgi:tetratricopeptide (TPR) repeat protein
MEEGKMKVFPRFLFGVAFGFILLGSVACDNKIDSCYAYLKSGNYKKAIEEGKQAIHIFSDDARGHLCLGIAYYNINDLNNAKYHFEEGLKCAIKDEDKLWEGISYEWLGLYYHKVGKREIAREYYNKAYEVFKSIGYQEGIKTVETLISKLESEEIADAAIDFLVEFIPFGKLFKAFNKR